MKTTDNVSYMLTSKVIKSFEPNSRGRIKNRDCAAGNRCKHFFPNMFITTPAVLYQFLFYFK